MDDKKGTGTGDKLKILKKYISEKNIIQGLRYIILALLVFLCGVIAVASFERGAGLPVILTLASAAALVFSMVMKIFVMRTFLRKIAWYVIDSLLLLVFTVFSSWGISLVFGSSYIFLVYMLVLSEYYLSAPSLRDCAIMFAVNLAAYTVVYIINAVVRNEFGSAFLISSQYFLVLIVLVLHFIMFNFAMTVSRKNKRAYEKVEEATVIEERNRIAKEIHDTAGHSLTTVIMQTEAARLAMEKDPARARHCIDAANLQAKNCLEELRLSVHLLSGRRENVTLKEYLEGILDETAEGTSFTVRSKIDDVEMKDEAERFISNTLREGISNGIRHGGSTAFFFELKDMGNYVELLLSDNGAGADMSKFKEGFGLSGMRAKAEALGGMINFSSEPGEGFEIRLSLPGSLKIAKNPQQGDKI